MNTHLRFLSYALCVSLAFFGACSGGDEPKPFDCNTSDLELSISTSVNPTSCTANDGAITVEATGGKEPYEYQIETSSFGGANVFENLGGGTFSITVKDKNDCTAEVSETLVIPGLNPLTATANATEDSECVTNNGTITVSASGGTGPYEYRLGTGAFSASETFVNVSSGGQTVTVKDAVGCMFTLSVSVPRGNTGITYTGDILEIFQAKCNFPSCHPENGDWFTYSTAKAKAATIKLRTENGSMPKSPAAPLSASQKALIACWVDDGAPQ